MPHVNDTTNAPENPFLTLARQLDRDLQKGAGSRHARVRRLADTLEALAAQNYELGKAEAVKEPK